MATRKDKFSVLSTAYEQLKAWFAAKTATGWPGSLVPPPRALPWCSVAMALWACCAESGGAGDAAPAPSPSAAASTEFPDALFRQLFAQSDLAMCILGADGVVALSNNRFVELFGLPASGLRAGARERTSVPSATNFPPDSGTTILDLLHHDAVVARDFILRLSMENRVAVKHGGAKAGSPPGGRPTVKVRTIFKTLHGALPVRALPVA